MFGGVTATHANVPSPSANRDCVRVNQSRVAKRQRRDAIGEIKWPLCAAAVKHIGVHTRTFIEGQAFGIGNILHVQRQHPRHQPSGAWHAKRCAILDEPARKPDMIGVMMRDNNAGNGPPLQWSGKQLFPNRTAAFGCKTCVDDRPSGAVIKRVDVHMVQRHRQRQSHPQHTGGHGHSFALGRRGREWVTDTGFEVSHQAARSSAEIAIRSAAPSRT